MRRVADWTFLFYVTILSIVLLVPHQALWLGDVGARVEEAIDKTVSSYLQHTLAYALLDALWIWRTGLRNGLWSGRSFAFPLIHGLAAECCQAFLPQRSCDWRDVVANTAGVIAVTAIMAAVVRRDVVPRAALATSAPSHQVSGSPN